MTLIFDDREKSNRYQKNKQFNNFSADKIESPFSTNKEFRELWQQDLSGSVIET
jgi:hypothetical protein